MRHDHSDGALRFGCAACVEQRRIDQAAAEVAEGPLRHIRVIIDVFNEIHEFTMKLPWPTGWTGAEVSEFYMHPSLHDPIEDALVEALAKLFASDLDLLVEAYELVEVTALIPGPRVSEPKVDPWEGQPSLFG